MKKHDKDGEITLFLGQYEYEFMNDWYLILDPVVWEEKRLNKNLRQKRNNTGLSFSENKLNIIRI